MNACEAPSLDDVDSPGGRRAILDEVAIRLSYEECDQAVNLIEPLYNSSNTDNEVRMLRASAHGCKAGIKFTAMLSFLQGVTLCSGGNCNGIWTALTEHFHIGNYVSPFPARLRISYSSGNFAVDALHSTLLEGIVVPNFYKTNRGSSNVGSVLISHREEEANIYLLFTSMATIGNYQNAFGQNASRPFDSTYQKRILLPWEGTDNTAMTEDGCSYASAVLNMVDAAVEVDRTLDLGIDTALLTALDTACVAKCIAPLVAEGCALTADECGSACPDILRDRKVCMGDGTVGVSADTVSLCGARAIIEVINDSAAFGWVCAAGGCP